MRYSEFKLEAAGMQHLPYEGDDGGKKWENLTQDIKNKWIQRQKSLYARAQRIFQRLVASMSPQDQAYVRGYKLVVPVRIALYQIAYNSYDDKEIALDLGTFWDMKDDTKI